LVSSVFFGENAGMKAGLNTKDAVFALVVTMLRGATFDKKQYICANQPKIYEEFG